MGFEPMLFRTSMCNDNTTYFKWTWNWRHNRCWIVRENFRKAQMWSLPRPSHHSFLAYYARFWTKSFLISYYKDSKQTVQMDHANACQFRLFPGHSRNVKIYFYLPTESVWIDNTSMKFLSRFLSYYQDSHDSRGRSVLMNPLFSQFSWSFLDFPHLHSIDKRARVQLFTIILDINDWEM